MWRLPSPVSPSTIKAPPPSPLAPSLNTPAPASASKKSSVGPLHGLAQELIHRSRTLGTVLQTALCYIGTVRRKLPKIASAPVAPSKEIKPEEPSQGGELATPGSSILSLLLRPHHTFLASLILALRFLQDRWYCDRAWVKLAGLACFEVSQGEEVLGDAPE